MLSIQQASEYLNVHKQTLRRWEKEGKLTVVRLDSGHRRYTRDELDKVAKKPKHPKLKKKNVIYCRVSSNKQKEDLVRQVNFMKELFPDHEVITDIGSGVNFRRPGCQNLLELLCSRTIGQIAISYRDRLCRVGFDLFEHLAHINGATIFVVHNIETSPEEELVEDLIAITTSFSARIHGLRKYNREYHERVYRKFQKRKSETKEGTSRS